MKGKGKKKIIKRPPHRFEGARFPEVVQALQYVHRLCGRARAIKILNDNGAKSVRDLQAFKYPVILAECSRVANYQHMIDYSGYADRPSFQTHVDRWFIVCEHELRYKHPELIES